jgi:hypothetical protein
MIECSPMDAAALWHVTVTVAGLPWPQAEVRAAIHRLVEEQPFFVTCRYRSDSAELTYWDQGADLHDPAAMALRLWAEHAVSAQLPPWRVVGLEVVDQATYRRRTMTADAPGLVDTTACKIMPF